LAGAFWLARKEMRRGWVSYPLSGVVMLFLGFMVLPSVSGLFELEGFGAGVQRVEDFYNAFFSDCLFLVICAFLAVNAVSGNRTPGRRDTFSSTLLLLGGLPVPAGSLVGSRAVCLLFALVLNVPSFFLPLYFLSDLGELGASYVWFVGTWIGYGLLFSGLSLLMGLTASDKTSGPIPIGVGAGIVAILAILEWTVGLDLVGRTAQLAQGYGPLPALLSILVGTTAFVLLAWLTVHRIHERDFLGELSA
jgi:hypothetical protein